MSLLEKTLSRAVTKTEDTKRAVKIEVRQASHDDGGPQVDIAVTWEEPDADAQMQPITRLVPRQAVIDNWDAGSDTFKGWVLAIITVTA